MIPPPLRRFLLLLALLVSAGILRAQKVSAVESLGDDTYSVTATATHKFTRNTAKLKAAAIETATRFCAKDGRHFQLVSADESKSMYLVGGMAATTVVFKARPTPEPAFAPSAAEAMAPARAGPAATPTDSLYDELTKLDELRKKGILTDDEFAAEKKKVLSRSK